MICDQVAAEPVYGGALTTVFTVICDQVAAEPVYYGGALPTVFTVLCSRMVSAIAGHSCLSQCAPLLQA